MENTKMKMNDKHKPFFHSSAFWRVATLFALKHIVSILGIYRRTGREYKLNSEKEMEMFLLLRTETLNWNVSLQPSTVE